MVNVVSRKNILKFIANLFLIYVYKLLTSNFFLIKITTYLGFRVYPEDLNLNLK